MAKKSIAIIKVEKWITRYGNKESDWDGLVAKQLPNGKWLCEIELPRIGVCAKAISKNEHNAVLSAANKASAVIREYLNANMNSSATINSIRNMGIDVGVNGEFVSTQLSKKQKERFASSIIWVKKNEINE